MNFYIKYNNFLCKNYIIILYFKILMEQKKLIL